MLHDFAATRYIRRDDRQCARSGLEQSSRLTFAIAGQDHDVDITQETRHVIDMAEICNDAGPMPVLDLRDGDRGRISCVRIAREEKLHSEAFGLNATRGLDVLLNT